MMEIHREDGPKVEDPSQGGWPQGGRPHDGQPAGRLQLVDVNRLSTSKSDARKFMIHDIARYCLLALVCVTAVPTPSSARTAFDGAWSVLIVTERGSCDRAYRYGVQIVDGIVTYDGGGAINLSGRVAPNGAVQVTVSAGGSRADGSGRLSKNAGRGNWKGRSSSDACSGYWEAERRG